MSWKDTLGAIAPTLATAFGGPLAGAATKFIAGKLLGDESAGIDEIENFVLGASPEQLTQLRDLDNEFKIEMKRLDIDVFKIQASDKKNARKEHKASRMPAMLSLGLTGVIGCLLYALFYIEPPEGAKEPLLIVLGMVVKEWSNAMHYWFGTTKSSQDKTRLIK